MKKIQVMMLMMLTAFLGFALQSCGSDDDNDTRQSFTLSLEIVDKGTMTQEQYAAVMAMLSQQETSVTVVTTESQAKSTLDNLLIQNKTTFQASVVGNTAKFTMAYILRNASGKIVYQRNVEVDGEKVTYN